MSSKIEVKLNREGVRELLLSSEMEQICKGYADKAVRALGDGYEADTFKGRNRVNASVSAVTSSAISENSETNTVIKAVLSSR